MGSFFACEIMWPDLQESAPSPRKFFQMIRTASPRELEN